MGLEAVIGDIRAKGQKEAEKIRDETRGQVREILDASQEKVEKIKTGVEESIEKQVRHLESQEISAANLVVKRERLNAQKGLLDDVYQRTLESLKGLPESFHREALRLLL